MDEGRGELSNDVIVSACLLLERRDEEEASRRQGDRLTASGAEEVSSAYSPRLVIARGCSHLS